MKPIRYVTLALPILALPLMAQAGTSFADQFTLTGSAAVTSDYTFRGVTQNDEHVTPQLGVELGHQSGIYAGLWGSPVDFNDGGEAHTEIDLTLGYRYKVDAWSADMRYVYYAYPGADSSLDYNYGEFLFGGAYDFKTIVVGGLFAYSPNFFADSGHAEYFQAKLDAPLPYNLSAHGYVGKQFVHDNPKFGFPDTVDWNIGMGYNLEKIGLPQANLDLSYIDTDLSTADCADGCSGRVVGTITYSF